MFHSPRILMLCLYIMATIPFGDNSADIGLNSRNITQNEEAITTINSTMVDKTSDQTIGGLKTFSEVVSMSSSLGIGGTAYAPLSVYGSSGQTNNGARRYFNYNTGNTAAGEANPSWNPIGIWAQSHIVTSGYFAAVQGTLVSSDVRIKKDIRDLDEDEAMEEIKNLRPVVYKYIDKEVHGSEDTRGFIAQEVAEVIPTAVRNIDDFIPNIYECVKVSDTYTITFEKYETTELKKGDSIRFIGALGVYRQSTITEIIDEKSIKINDDWTSDLCDMSGNRGGDCLFCYGVQINDFKNLNYDTVLTSLVSAVKQLDKRLQELEPEVKKKEVLEKPVEKKEEPQNIIIEEKEKEEEQKGGRFD